MNRITIIREIDGYTFKAVALYSPNDDGWRCSIAEAGSIVEERDYDQTGNDALATLIDMLDLALSTARSRDAMIAGPFSDAQCA